MQDMEREACTFQVMNILNKKVFHFVLNINYKVNYWNNSFLCVWINVAIEKQCPSKGK